LKRLLVTGVIRSGTTKIAQDVAERVLGIELLPEMRPLAEILGLADRWRAVASKKSDPWIGDGRFIDSLVDATVEHLFAQRLAASWTLGKEPGLTEYPKELTALVSRLSIPVLLCVRDPLDVIASALEVQRRQEYGHSRHFYVQTVWRSFEGLLLLLAEASRSRHFYVVRYEDYVEEPEKTLEAVAKWLDVDFGNSKTVTSRTQHDESDPYFTELLDQPPSDGQVGSFRSRLSSAQLSYLADVFSGVRATLGYQPVTSSRHRSRLGERTFRDPCRRRQ